MSNKETYLAGISSAHHKVLPFDTSSTGQIRANFIPGTTGYHVTEHKDFIERRQSEEMEQENAHYVLIGLLRV
jgi:hypothetical protein